MPKPKIETGGQARLEKILAMGMRALENEADRSIEPRRAGGFMLSTMLAMGLTMGMFPGKAEARGRWLPSKQDISMEANKQTSIEMSKMEQRQRGKIQQLENERADLRTRFGDLDSRLDFEYQNGRISREDYAAAKKKLAEERGKMEQEYAGKIRNAKVGLQISGKIFQGIRGW